MFKKLLTAAWLVLVFACCQFAAAATTVTVSATPSNPTAPANVTLAVAATSDTGPVMATQVEYFNGTTSLGIVLQAPFTLTVNELAAGTYQITAKVTTTDPNNPMVQSPPLALLVGTPPGAATAYFIHTDQLDTPRVITNSNGASVWQWDSDPFGKEPANEQPAGQPAFAYNPRFPGQQFDRESNLHYNYHRDYDPSLGRYVESDPIGLKGGINTYAYVGGNPASYSDALGLLVTAVLDRNAGTLTVTDNDTGQSVTASAFTGGNTNPDSGWNVREIAAPDGDYYITPNVNQKAGHEDWFSLLQKKTRIDDTFYDNEFRRSGARLHWGSQSFGCVTVDKNTPGNDKNWKAIRSLIMNTKKSMINYHPDYNSMQFGTVNLPSYGTLTIK